MGIFIFINIAFSMKTWKMRDFIDIEFRCFYRYGHCPNMAIMTRSYFLRKLVIFRYLHFLDFPRYHAPASSELEISKRPEREPKKADRRTMAEVGTDSLNFYST